MEEFRAAHSRMFGQSNGDRVETKVTLIDANNKVNGSAQNNLATCDSTHSDKVLNSVSNSDVEIITQSVSLPDNNENEASKLFKANAVQQIQLTRPIINSSKSNLTTTAAATTANGETVTILRTTSPCKKAPPPPVPVKKPSTPSTIVTISSYEEPKNRFLNSKTSSCNNKSITPVISADNTIEYGSDKSFTNEIPCNKDNSQNHDNLHPISIKINVK